MASVKRLPSVAQPTRCQQDIIRSCHRCQDLIKEEQTKSWVKWGGGGLIHFTDSISCDKWQSLVLRAKTYAVYESK